MKIPGLFLTCILLKTQKSISGEGLNEPHGLEAKYSLHAFNLYSYKEFFHCIMIHSAFTKIPVKTLSGSGHESES